MSERDSLSGLRKLTNYSPESNEDEAPAPLHQEVKRLFAKLLHRMVDKTVDDLAANQIIKKYSIFQSMERVLTPKKKVIDLENFKAELQSLLQSAKIEDALIQESLSQMPDLSEDWGEIFVEMEEKQAAIFKEITNWKSNLQILENQLVQLKLSRTVPQNFRPYMFYLISQATIYRSYDRSEPSSSKLINIRALVGEIQEFLEKIRKVVTFPL